MDSDLTLRLGDVGLSKYTRHFVCDLQELGTSQLDLFTLNVPCAAPELLKYGRVSQQSEAFSVGVVLFELFSGMQVYRDKTAKQVEKEILEGKRCAIPKFVDRRIRNLITICWNHDPDQRPMLRVRLVCSHPRRSKSIY